METSVRHAATPPAQTVDVRHILRRHRAFMLAASLAFSGLIAEEAWATAQFWSPNGAQAGVALGLISVLVALIGNALAFLLPVSLVDPSKFERPLGAFASAAIEGIGITILSQVVVFLLLLRLASGDLVAAYNLLRDLYLYTLVAAVLFHGLLYYVRHMHWLYEQFGGADSPLKPIAASGGIGAIILIVTLALFPLDVRSIDAAPLALRGLVGLHVYGRDLYLVTLALGAYIWHLRWIADH